MAEAAAHAAALKAFQDAMRQGDNGYNQHESCVSLIGDSSSLMMSGDLRAEQFAADEMRLMQSLHLNTLDHPRVDVLQGLMGLAPVDQPSDDTTAHELLRLLEQQQQQQWHQENASMHASHETLHRRPERHYLTIAQNGKPEYDD